MDLSRTALVAFSETDSGGLETDGGINGEVKKG